MIFEHSTLSRIRGDNLINVCCSAVVVAVSELINIYFHSNRKNVVLQVVLEVQVTNNS